MIALRFPSPSPIGESVLGCLIGRFPFFNVHLPFSIVMRYLKSRMECIRQDYYHYKVIVASQFLILSSLLDFHLIVGVHGINDGLN